MLQFKDFLMSSNFLQEVRLLSQLFIVMYSNGFRSVQLYCRPSGRPVLKVYLPKDYDRSLFNSMMSTVFVFCQLPAFNFRSSSEKDGAVIMKTFYYEPVAD